jgi:regulatory protein
MPLSDRQLLSEDSSTEEVEAVNSADIRLAAMNFLSRREHSRRELEQKLMRRFPDEEQVGAEIQRLATENLQSDVRFAESYALARANRGYGLCRVRQEMRERGLSDSEITLAIESVDIDWPTLAREVYRKKFGEQCASDLKEKAKRIRFMEYRGFDREHYHSLMNN